MASSSSLFFYRNFSTYNCIYFLLILIFSVSTKLALGCYTSIFSFGDSLADTGNLLHISDSSIRSPHFALPPYAQDLGLPLVPPYFRGQNESAKNFKGGVNFAVVGATALDNEVFEERGIRNPFTNTSLGDQMGWFKEMLPSLYHSPSIAICISPDCNNSYAVLCFSWGK
ncbi:hypothetical protein RHMOL_Rhmol02G0156700 [Rhododendron molle]|uniref:Uncharacterized protein n=1 Tax=Rhododendron molle TaxID=49168 RepID=A0ACC0PQ82_RHOML|nr:hypothetical protein RHMOL_Rhmol02G0156700 [Rhododendron molle]